jgi:predicted trehalose synthase
MASKTPPSELAGWLARQRWFAGKTRRIVETRVDDCLPLRGSTIFLVGVTLDDGARDRYLVALEDGHGLADAFDNPGFCRALLDVMGAADDVRGDHGALIGRPSRAFPHRLPPDVPVRRIAGEQSNTSIVFEGAVIVKHFRRVADGLNPDLEITRFLTEQTSFRNTPRLAGALEYVADDGRRATVAVAHELVPDGRDGWQWLLDRLAAGDEALDALRGLGRRTAELHLALATPSADPAFTAEAIGRGDVAAWTAAIERQVTAARAAAAGSRLPDVPAGIGTALAGLLGASKIRHHGDFHLGQTLCVRDGADFVLIDFEGEPLRPLDERRRKHTPLRDVAGMLRSFAYAAATVARSGHDVGRWEERARQAFLDGYRAAAGTAPFLPAGGDAFARAVAVLELEKAAYEVVYEANNRPDWVSIPLRGLVTATASLARAAGAA